MDSNERSIHRTAKKERFYWTTESTMKLIGMLELECSVIWDTKHKSYKERHTRQAKVEHLADTFETTVDEINRKIHNLRSQFNAECRKVQKRRQVCGEEYTSSWVYFEPLSFLLSPDALDVSLDNAESSGDITLAEYQPSYESVAGDSPHGSDRSGSPQDLKQPLFLDVQREQHTQRRRKRRHLDTVDESQIFGDFVASELRQLPTEESRKKLKRLIQKAILLVAEEDNPNFL